MACFITRHYTNNSITNTSTQQMTGTGKSPALAAELCCFPCSDSFPVFHYSAGTGQKKERAAKMLPCRCNLDARSLVLYNEYERGFYHVP